MIHALHFLVVSFSSFKSWLSSLHAPLKIHIIFLYNLGLFIHHAYIEDIECPQGIYSSSFDVDGFSRLFLHPSNFLINDLRSL